MDFTLTDEQQMVRDTARALLQKECPPALVRAHADDPAAAAPLWGHLREWVVLGDGPTTDLALFAEECGAVVAPGPYFATAALFLPVLRAAGLTEEADAVAAGEATGTVALAGADGRWCTDPVTADPVRTFVPEADGVDRVALVLPGPELLVVDRAQLDITPVATLDTSRRVATLPVPPGARGVSLPAEALAAAIERATVVLAAELVGTARWLVEASVAYGRERIQFDRPIGSFQAVQHQLVDMALDLERATAAVYYAAMALDAGDPDRHRAAAVAKAAAGTAARHAAKSGMQIHAGIGYTWEHDLHLYLRRAYASDDLLGDVTFHHDRLADLLLG